tara:strand:+ start:1495 stop:2919 length:1425 start_codon:yes stop_codon:yes gene_type:complete
MNHYSITHVKQSPMMGVIGYGGGATSLSRYADSGRPFWILTDGSMDTSDNLRYKSLDVDNVGNIYVGGNVVDNNTSPAYYQHIQFNSYTKAGAYNWQRRLQVATGEQTNYDMVLSGSHLYAAGNSQSNKVPMIKLSTSNGHITWQKQMKVGTSSYWRDCRGVDVDSSGNQYWMTDAQYFDSSNKAVYVFKTNSSGTMQWDKYFTIANPGGPSNYTPYPNKIKLDDSGNIYLAMQVGGSSQYDWDAYLVKMNSSGVIQWDAKLGSTGSYSAQSWSDVAIDSSGNVYVCGKSRANSPSPDRGLIAKYNSSGTIQWQRQYGDSGNPNFFACDLVDDTDFYVGGSTDSWGKTPIWIKFNTSGEIQYQRYLRDNQNNNADHMDTIKVVGDNLYGSGQRYIGSSKYHGMVWTLPSDGSLQGTYGHFTYGAFTHGMADTSFPTSAPGASSSDCTNCTIAAPDTNLAEATTSWSIQQFEEVE